jgi:hypothetical protein
MFALLSFNSFSNSLDIDCRPSADTVFKDVVVIKGNVYSAPASTRFNGYLDVQIPYLNVDERRLAVSGRKEYIDYINSYAYVLRGELSGMTNNYLSPTIKITDNNTIGVREINVMYDFVVYTCQLSESTVIDFDIVVN